MLRQVIRGGGGGPLEQVRKACVRGGRASGLHRSTTHPPVDRALAHAHRSGDGGRKYQACQLRFYCFGNMTANRRLASIRRQLAGQYDAPPADASYAADPPCYFPTTPL